MKNLVVYKRKYYGWADHCHQQDHQAAENSTASDGQPEPSDLQSIEGVILEMGKQVLHLTTIPPPQRSVTLPALELRRGQE